jgi:hypothetical protein
MRVCVFSRRLVPLCELLCNALRVVSLPIGLVHAVRLVWGRCVKRPTLSLHAGGAVCGAAVSTAGH